MQFLDSFSLRLGVFCLFVFHSIEVAFSEKGDYVGCFQDQEENKLLSEVEESLESEQGSASALASCVDLCSEGGYPFAGIQRSSVCYCGYNRPPLIARRLDSECSSPCSGGSPPKCGGEFKLSVYETGVSATGNTPNPFHLGCFRENTGKDGPKLLPDLHQEFSDLTPKICSEFCFKKGFKISGLQNGKDCFCTNNELDNSKKVSGDGCNVNCVGDGSKKCGGAQHLNVYSTGLTGNTAYGRYIACYWDQPDEKGHIVRLLPDFKSELRNTLSPGICMNICYQMGFKYSGVELGYECYCGNTLPDESKARTDLECRLQCEGSPGEVCGGHWRLQVYKTPLLDDGVKESVEHVGCYIDHEENRLGESREKNSLMTPIMCTDLCSKRGYPFAGLHGGTECLCRYNRPANAAKRLDADCSKPCAGAQHLKCGGINRLSIYTTGVSSVGSIPAGLRLGCFSENTEEKVNKSGRLFPDVRQNFTELTPKICSEYCFRAGFKMSAVNRNDCLCTNKTLDTKKKVGDSECSVPCAGDSTKKCGASGRVTVYATGLTDSPKSGHKVGCFVDIPDESGKLVRGMPDFRTELPLTNSPRTCFNLCHQMGFKYAALQAGWECYCSRWPPPKEKNKPDHHCNTDCTGSPREKCGGHWHLEVYKTPLAGDGDGEKPKTPTPTPTPPPIRGQIPADLEPTTSPVNCRQLSTTIVNGQRACKNDVIFRDEFSKLDLNRWSHEIKIPNKPDFEFTVFDSKPENSFVSDGILHIQPTVYDDNFVRGGSIELDKCTGEGYNGECSRNTDDRVLPPTQSARINTKGSFTFKYGVVEIQAKLPIGDWILPEIWLLPADHSYGPDYASGKIRLLARGNRHLKYEDGREMGVETVEASVMIGSETDVKEKSIYFTQIPNQFQNFSIIWTRDDIAFSINGKRRHSIMANSRGLRLNDVVGFPSAQYETWKKGSSIAPFDQPFYISLGLSVGGQRDFPNNVSSSGYTKPWSNTSPKAVLNFWNKRNEWQRTWQGDTALQIKSIKVTAL